MIKTNVNMPQIEELETLIEQHYTILKELQTNMENMRSIRLQINLDLNPE